jgi:phosphoribosylformylglycinamidine cyclo-ligase
VPRGRIAAAVIADQQPPVLANGGVSTGGGGFGAFAGLYPLDDRRLLAASTDGVGTKLILARERGALRACGADLAAHCINDVLTTGAAPLFLLDYVAANRISLDEVAELVDGAAEVCRAAGVALLGGHTVRDPEVIAAYLGSTTL